MTEQNVYLQIILACLLIILSYLYNVIAKKTAIPSVLLLLLTGIGVKELVEYRGLPLEVPPNLVELFGILGLIMIILEAGLDIQMSEKKKFLSAMASFRH